MHLSSVNRMLREMVEMNMRGLETLRPSDMIGDSDKLTRYFGGEMRPFTAKTKKFQAMMVKLTGKKQFTFDDAYTALIKYGLDKNAAYQYALFAAKRFGRA